MKLLILNSFSRNSLAVVNALDPAYELFGGYDCQGIKAWLSRHFTSPRISDIVRIRDPRKDEAAFEADIVDAVRRLGLDAVMATGTTHSDYLSAHKRAIEATTGAKVLIEDFDKLSRVTDKWGVYQLCQSLGVTTPRSTLPVDYRDLPGAAAAAGIDYPFLIKPRRSYGSIGVAMFESPADTAAFVSRVQRGEFDFRPGEFILQELIQGPLHDVTSCARDGQILSLLSQERLLTWHDFGGGGIINRTTKTSQTLEAVEKILAATSWNGIAEFDFIKGRDGNFYLLECNPKIWGTTQLTVEAGLNMPQQLVDFMYFGKNVKPLHEYEVGLVYKWLFPECLAHLFQKPRGIKPFLRRLAKVVRRYDGTRTRTNIHPENLAHFIGVLLNKSIL